MKAASAGLRLAPQSWMVAPETRAILAALAAGGADARFVGGAVRQAVLGAAAGGSSGDREPRHIDIDIATPAPPERVLELLRAAGIKVVPTGLSHGTVTAVVGSRHFEITTLRRDVETDGRHARVAFDADWAGDAARRDFTINAIFLAPDGTLYDPVGGLEDLAQHRVRFVGDPVTRIAEDVLRLLRYYRFEAHFGSGAGDAGARAACRAAVHWLPSLSAERVAQELRRLLAAPDPGAALTMMQADGVLAAVLPEARRLDRLRRLIAIEPQPDALRRLAALVEIDRAGADAIALRLRLANAWRDRLRRLAPPWPIEPAADTPVQRRALYRLGAEDYRDLSLLLAADGRIERPRLAALLALAAGWTPPIFPLTGRDVTQLGIAPGERVGRLLDTVRDWWVHGDFTADRRRCLAHLRQIAHREELSMSTNGDARR